MGNRYSPPTPSAFLATACLAGLLPFAGCGPTGPTLPDTASATGTVTYQGEPVEGATVLFTRGSGNIAEGEMAIGKTGAGGRFELTTHVSGQADVKGAPAGAYKVAISKQIPPPEISESEYQAMVDAANKISETGAMVPPDQQPPGLVEMFPPKYSVAVESELKAEVTAQGPNDFQFDLE
ncbi:MAG: carboxypeptidase-like regulatory domain-containing protein [Planctomycetota bacterium]